MKTIKQISNAGNVSGRYIVASDTPDRGRSVWPECFGPNAMSGRAFFASDDMSEAMSQMDGDCVLIDRKTGREVK